VTTLDVENNRVIVADNDSLFTSGFAAEEVNWIGGSPENGAFEADIKIRYLHKPSKGKVTPLEKNRISVEFLEKQRAITAGQSVVFYDDDVVLGGGIIA
ncbi:MAG: aminomethyltransferase beta-barrel domain-containing protein, partial [Candidatus Zixiibacteriota bacterium]